MPQNVLCHLPEGNSVDFFLNVSLREKHLRVTPTEPKFKMRNSRISKKGSRFWTKFLLVNACEEKWNG